MFLKANPCCSVYKSFIHFCDWVIFNSMNIPQFFVVQLLSWVRLFCNIIDCSPPGSSVHEILWARILEWVAISFSRGSSRPRDQIHVSFSGNGFFTTELPGKPIPQFAYPLIWWWTLGLFVVLTFWGTTRLFSKAMAPLPIPTSSLWGFCFSHPCQYLLLLVFIVVILVGVKWYLTMVLIDIFLMTNNGRAFFYVLIGHSYISFGEMCSQRPLIHLWLLTVLSDVVRRPAKW